MAASISSSTFVVGVAQVDGRHYVVETHIDNALVSHIFEYLCDANLTDIDRTAIMNARAAALLSILVAMECLAMLQLGAPLTFVYATKAQLGNAFRAAFKVATQVEAERLAKWLLDHIDAGDFTDAQVQSFFGYTTTQYNNLKARATTMRTEYNDMLAAAGE